MTPRKPLGTLRVDVDDLRMCYPLRLFLVRPRSPLASSAGRLEAARSARDEGSRGAPRNAQHVYPQPGAVALRSGTGPEPGPVTASLRWVGALENALMRVTQPVLERQGINFLTVIVHGARPHFALDGRLFLVVSPLEQAELPSCVSGLAMVESRVVRGIPGPTVAVYTFAGKPAGEHASKPHPKEASPDPQRAARKVQKDGTR